MTEKKIPETLEDKDLDQASGGVGARLSGLRRVSATEAETDEAAASKGANNLKQLGLGVTSGDGSA
jgi:hypothetical protein